MKKSIISLCIAIALLLAMLPQITLSVDATESAESGTCGDNLTWTFADGALFINGTGPMDDYYSDNYPWYHLRSNIISVSIGNNATSIGDSAFYDCTNLTNVAIGNDVTTIGDFAFSECQNLLNITFPEQLECIGDYAFRNCKNLNNIVLPDSVTYIGKTAFYGCSCLESVALPSNITFISDFAFADCKNLASVFIPNSVSDIRFFAFSGCISLNNITIPDSVITIGQYAFSDCISLNSITIPANLTSISAGTFYNCSSLTCVTMPQNMTEIRAWAFDGCLSLSDVYYAGSANEWNKVVVGDNNDALGTATFHYGNPNGFGLWKNGWTFANATESFAEEPTSHAEDYFIPRERYDDLFGSSYVDSTEGLYTEEWGGNCAGMSATAILFFLDSLDWESIAAEYSEDFYDPNDFYRTVNLHNQSQSYYPAISNDTEVTRLIEAYQLYINAIDKSRLTNNLDNAYFATEVEEKNTLFGKEYVVNHISASEGGTYIASMLEEFQEAYDENNPLLIVLQADGFGHGIVSRTDLKPEDMGDGWWRVYVYDPNKPYINESVTSTVSGVEAEPKYTFGCNTLVDNGGDIYLELNPSLNQWRYCTSVNSNSADSYIGSSPSGELLWKTYYHDATPDNENDDEGKKNNAKIPDFFYTIDLTDLTMEDFSNPHFDSTSAWIPENDLAVAVDGSTDCSIYASTGELVAIVEDGDAFVLSDAGSYDAYIGQTEDGGSLGGKIYLPNDVYTVYYTSGAVQFLGSDNALSFSCDGAAELTVDITLNSLQILAQEDGIAAVKCANVTSTDECSYVDTEGALVAGETFTIAYSDENKVEASTDSKDGEFQLYQKDADQEEAVATKVIKTSSLWWLWVVGGIAVVLLAAIIWVQRKKK